MTLCGTWGFMAPEIAAAQGYTSPRCDLWAVGVLLFECVSGCTPFRFADPQGALYDPQKAFSQAAWVKPPWNFGHAVFEKVSDDCKDLISKLLAYEPRQRLSASQALKHRWLAGDDKTRLSLSAKILSDTLQRLEPGSPSLRLRESRRASSTRGSVVSLVSAARPTVPVRRSSVPVESERNSIHRGSWANLGNGGPTAAKPESAPGTPMTSPRRDKRASWSPGFSGQAGTQVLNIMTIVAKEFSDAAKSAPGSPNSPRKASVMKATKPAAAC